MQKQQRGQTLKGSSSANPSSKRKQLEKPDRQPPKKPKVAFEPVLGLKAEGKKTVSEKPLVLLHENSKYALEWLSSIIAVDDYEDLSNHATEPMGETGLFCIA